jgi:hypothetical protein
MKRLLLLLGFLLLGAANAQGQQTIVQATVLDPRTFPYQGGGGTFTIQCPGNNQPYVNRSPIPRSIPINTLSGSGSFTTVLYDTSFMTDVNNAPLVCQWKVSINDQCQAAFFSTLVTGVTGAGPVNLSAQINAAAVNLSAACTPPGIVNSVSLGNLPPLFNTSVTGNPLNPSFTFAQISQTQNLFFASPNGSSGNPTFRAIVAADLPGGAGTVTSFSSGNFSPLFNTSVSNPTTTPNQTFAAINQSPNLVFAGPSSGGAAAPTFRSLVGADLPTPTVSTLGGVFSKAAVTHQFFTSLANSGTFTSAQPAAGDISGLNFTQIATASGAGCSPGSSASYDACLTTLTWSTAFADTSYIPVCTGLQLQAQSLGSGSNLAPMLIISGISASQITVITQQERSITSNFTTIYCLGVHP